MTDLLHPESVPFLRALAVGSRFRFALRMGEQVRLAAGPLTATCPRPAGDGPLHSGVGWIAPDGVLILAGPTLSRKVYKQTATRPGPKVLAHCRMLRTTADGRVAERIFHPRAWKDADRPAFGGTIPRAARLIEKAAACSGTLWLWITEEARTGQPHIAALPAARDQDGQGIAALVAHLRGAQPGTVCQLTVSEGTVAIAAAANPQKVSATLQAIVAAHSADHPDLSRLIGASVVGFRGSSAAAVARVEVA